jgi:hypothetical protein
MLPHGGIMTSPQEQNGEPHPKENYPRACVSLWRWVVSFFTGLRTLEVFTLILAFSTSIQVWAFMKSERAFLSIETMLISGNQIRDGSPIVFSMQIRNSGRSTSFITNTLFTVSIRPDDLPLIPNYSPQGKDFRGPVPAQGVYNATIIPRGVDQSPQYIVPSGLSEQVQNGTMRIYVYGFIHYRDDYSNIFGERKTGFCWIYNPLANPSVSQFDNCDARYTEYIYAD